MRTTIIMVFALMTCSQRSVIAQRQPVHQFDRRVPVTIVLVEDLPLLDAPFLLQRRPRMTPHDLILLRADASAEQLSDAVRALLTIRQTGGDTAASAAMMRMRPRQAIRGTRREFPWVQSVLADLRRASLRDVPGIGSVRAVEIWLPPQRPRAVR